MRLLKFVSKNGHLPEFNHTAVLIQYSTVTFVPVQSACSAVQHVPQVWQSGIATSLSPPHSQPAADSTDPQALHEMKHNFETTFRSAK